MKVADVNINNQGLKMEIIAYRKYKDIDVQFEDGTIVKNEYCANFKKGLIKNRFYPSVYGVGYLGNIKGNDKNGKPFKSYAVWEGMLRRCYQDKYLENHPTYKECSVCEEWHNYENFKKWFDENYYEIDDETMNLDKDILVKGNKIYSPNTCIFVPQKINGLFVKTDALRGDLPIGVCKKGNKFIAKCNLNGKRSQIGTFDTPIEAFQSYKQFKEQYIKQVAEEYKNKIPSVLYDAMYRWEVDIND